MIYFAKEGLRFDPRIKILILFICVITATITPSLNYELEFVLLIGVFAIVNKKWKYAIKTIAIYLFIYFLSVWIIYNAPGSLRGILMAFLGLVHKVYPCAMMSGIVISTTKVSEFLAAMNKSRIPQKLIIPIAVMLRYLPSIQEDWHYIKDAMKMRGISPSLKGFITNPVITVNCIYVPLMMAASKVVDELTIASTTRGIENPSPRTSLLQIKINKRDIFAVLIFILFLIFGFYLRR
ncbi:energy-coupling factor transporter transmembrane component T family protein [Clostridioides difficile]|uniref:energy-coupling factor transporter transmembrane component T family protein n=1 Tax=Clostridioides difficile TaxID=1496 RepID=UPI000D1F67ED|nr:energy-coupling factor transporter transmembrane component T [Clostridioides difficile]MDN9574533.1 energy-coupling factor transporter transmembrane protein EcfT [Clostridioides difficile]HBF4557147.1 energy-coupling factor transporter transmembrane protein EcfT [Clostridioides difficile]HCQ5580211.1 energy-coupling factor transporter transmembrane protein EcfT [Clostridioides difficile]